MLSEKNDWRRAYDRERYQQRRLRAISQLGDKCAKCGSMQDLEIDHIDPKTKVFELASGPTVAEREWQSELLKCQVLCSDCHDEKTALERGMTPTKGHDVHGTLTSVRWCKCDECRAAKRAYMKAYGEKRTKVGLRGGLKPAHGTYGSYRNGCRCDDCRFSNTLRMRDYNVRRAGRNRLL